MQKTSNIKLFYLYSKLLAKSNFQYKANAIFLSLGVFIRESVNVIVMLFILKKFNSINGWDLNEMLFLYSIIFLTYSLLVLFFTGIRDFSSLVQSGGLDRYLVRPMGIIFQTVASKADYFASIGHGLIGIILFSYASSKVGIIWDLQNIIYCISIVIGGVSIQLSIWLFAACFSFWIIKSDNLVQRSDLISKISGAFKFKVPGGQMHLFFHLSY